MNEKLKKRSAEIAYALFKPEEHNHRVFIACFCWHRNRLVQIGVNKNCTHTINLRNPLVCRRTGVEIKDKGVCAELNAFITIKNRTNYDFNDLSIVNVRVDRKFEIKNSRPCFSCESLFRFTSPKEVWYSVGGTRENPVFCKY